MDPDQLPTLTYGTIDADYVRRLASLDPADDGPLWMVNLMRYRDRAVYPDGRASDLTGREADDRYAPFGPFRTIGAELVFLSDVDEQLIGDDQRWDRIAVVRYPTRRSFLDMQDLPEYVELHEHKDAGMASTFVIGCPRPRCRRYRSTHRRSMPSPTPRPPTTAPSSSSTSSATTRAGCPRT